MDVNLLRAIITALCFFAFLLIIYWAFGPRSKHRFDAAANLPFADQEIDKRSSQSPSVSKHAMKPEQH